MGGIAPKTRGNPEFDETPNEEHNPEANDGAIEPAIDSSDEGTSIGDARSPMEDLEW